MIEMIEKEKYINLQCNPSSIIRFTKSKKKLKTEALLSLMILQIMFRKCKRRPF